MQIGCRDEGGAKKRGASGVDTRRDRVGLEFGM